MIKKLTLNKSVNKIIKVYNAKEIKDFDYVLKNVDLPLKKTQNLIKNLINMPLNSIQEELSLVIMKIKAVPMIIHKKKCAHRKKFINNTRNITGGPGKYPIKVSKLLLKALKYIISVNKDLGLQGYDNSKLIILKEASATKGRCLKSAFYRAMGRMTLKKRQKVHINFKVARLKIYS